MSPWCKQFVDSQQIQPLKAPIVEMQSVRSSSRTSRAISSPLQHVHSDSRYVADIRIYAYGLSTQLYYPVCSRTPVLFPASKHRRLSVRVLCWFDSRVICRCDEIRISTAMNLYAYFKIEHIALPISLAIQQLSIVIKHFIIYFTPYR